MLDLRYLDKFAGTHVKIKCLLDPSTYRNLREMEYYGCLADNSELCTYLDEGEFETGLVGFGKVRGSTSLPYLGRRETVWEIQRSDDGSILLAHKRIGEKDYKIIGPDGQEMGILSGLELPYKSIIQNLEGLKKGKNGDEYLEAMDKIKYLFDQWRRSLIQ